MKTRTNTHHRTARPLLAALVLLATLLIGGVAPAHAAAPGTVVAWGTNASGQTSVPAGLSNVTAIDGGYYHSLALKSDGTVVAWGGNSDGQTSVPAGLSNVTAIAAGGFHSLALKSDGTAVAWGYNSDGQSSVPAGLSGVTAIAGGIFHSLALKSDGTVVAWGGNFDGQSSVPAGLSNVTAIAAGDYHSLALKSDGTVVAWGYNYYGQVSGRPTEPIYTAIAAGFQHSLALKSDGTVVAWGDNTYGQTSVPAGLSNVTAIAAGENHSLALKSDGTVVAWGRNSDGQSSVPAGLSGVTAIAAGGLHSLALVPDTTTPIITANVVGTLGSNGWYVSDVTVSWSAVDNESAITSQFGCGTTTFTADTLGTRLVCLATSGGGAANQSVTIKRDATAPSITASAQKADNTPYTAGTWTNQNVTVHFTCDDALSGVVACPADQVIGGADGAFTATGTASDNAGNTASASFGPIQIDKTAPTITAAGTKADNTPYNAGTWTNQSVTVHFTCADTGSGVASCPADQVISPNGSFTAVGTATDNLGYTASASFGPIQIDKSAPTLTASGTKADGTPYTAGTWTNQNVTVHFTCIDALAGIASCPTDQVISPNGSFTAVGTASDTAGNTASASFGPIQIDKTAPTISGSRTPAANANGWNNSSVSVSFSCADTLSGLASNTVAGAVVSAEGTDQSVTNSGVCVDTAGNAADAVTVSGIKIDTTAPIISAAATSAPNLAGWYNTPVTIHFTCADALSGLDGACPADQTLSTEGTAVSSTAQSVSDLAGNTSDPSNIVTVKLDRIAPTTTGSASTSGTQATVTLAASDALSGIAGTSYSVNGGAAQSYSAPFVLNGVGNYTISFFSTDVAGNAEATKTLNVTINAPANGVLDSFNRANGAVGSNWEGLTSSDFYKIASNKLDVQLGGPLVWKPTSFGASQEAFVTLSTIDSKSPSQGVLLKVQTGSIPTAGAIGVVYDAVAKAVRVSTLRLGQNGAWTLYPGKAVTFANGDVLGARALSNGDVQIYKNGTLIATITLNTADKAFFNAKGGKIGIWTAAAPNALFDDFGGGSVTP